MRDPVVRSQQQLQEVSVSGVKAAEAALAFTERQSYILIPQDKQEAEHAMRMGL